MRSLRHIGWLVVGCAGWLGLEVPAQTPPSPDDWPARATALAAAPDCAPVVAAALDDPHWYVRARAIQTLGRQRCAAAVPALLARFDHEDWDNQARLLVALGQIGDPAGLPPVARAATGPAGTLRTVALGALGGFAASQVAPILAAALEQPLNHDEKRIVARQIGAFRLADYAPRLADWLGQDEELDRLIAVAQYRTGNQAAGRRVIEAFDHLDAPTRLQLLGDWAERPDARATALLLEFLRSDSPEHRLAAARAWAAYGAQMPVAETLTVLPDVEAEVRNVLVTALGGCPAEETVAAVIERLKAEPPAAARTAYLAALEALDREMVTAALLAARQARLPFAEQALEKLGITPEALAARLAAPTLPPTARVTLALQLGQLGDLRAFDLLRQAFLSGDEATRCAAAEALGRLHDARAVELLLDALDDDGPRVRSAAAASLARLGMTPKRLVAALDAPNSTLRIEALRLLGRLRDISALPAIAAQAREGEPLPVRLAAVAALGHLHHAEAVPVLVRLLSAREPAMRMHVVSALGESGDARAVAALLPLLRDPDAAVVGKVITALSRTKAPSAVTPLLAALQHPDWRVRAAVARSLEAWEDARIPPALAAALEDPSALVRFHARQSLLKLAVAPETLLPVALGQSRPRGWYGAYVTLQELAPEALRDGVRRSLDAPDPKTRALAAALLRHYPDPDTQALLWQRIDTETRFAVRWWLVRALAGFGEAAREGAMKRTRSKNARLRADAMRILGWLPANRESRLVLREGLSDAENHVRSAAVEALGRIGDAAALAPLLARQSGAFTIAPDELMDALLACGDAGRAVLRQAVDGSEPAIRALLLQRLGADGHPDALPLLLEGLRDVSPLVRQAARQGLARQSDERAAQALAALPDEP
ncbi:HEAT repeat domain-containing protein [Chloracidobacterium sp. MS 40/45]|uniref:HEAT repeat domain-containing protein n=1 Tax=Chloracidobacterium aggregatum TaxID=2851959 RepID=UPI001B8C6CB8|nr:HEAT repeat domain-containing protein [Chloracidobacterium aggregatum]QUW00105.1 HEAT repeat domain-containing protein [Chloracidobacterium sp. MS 40/45]